MQHESNDWERPARLPRKQYSAPLVAHELRELLENSNYVTKAAEIGRIIQAENGVGVACDAIEKQLPSERQKFEHRGQRV